MTSNNLLKNFLNFLGISQEETIRMLEDNTFQIQLDDNHSIALELDEKTGDIIFSSELAIIKKDYIPQMALLLLQANVFWSGTNGGTLGFDQSNSTAILLDRISSNIDLKAFEAKLTAFLEAVTIWAKHLEQLQQEESFATQENITELIPENLNFRNLV